MDAAKPRMSYMAASDGANAYIVGKKTKARSNYEEFTLQKTGNAYNSPNSKHYVYICGICSYTRCSSGF